MKILESYDSATDTEKHIKRVQELIQNFATNLISQGKYHDETKLSKEEKALFDIYTPKLKTCTYDSDEYKQYLKDLKPALDHHYANNSHHPEHYSNGISGMTLFDIVEMLIDWKASSERHGDGDIRKSIEINAKRFNMSEQLVDIFNNTVNKWESI